MTQPFTFSSQLTQLAQKAEQACGEVFAEIEKIKEYNEQKVLKAFIDQRVSEHHFLGTSGYGYGDVGRDTLDAVFAQIMGCEDALVRHNFVSGTHALTTALFGVLRPGDTLLAASGKPYDTLEEVIGIRSCGMGSLKDFGVLYDQVDLLPNGQVDIKQVLQKAKTAKVVYLQRSRGYSLRESIDVETIGEIARQVKAQNPNAIVMVDNCYGEFCQTIEPTQAGADLMIGSLIKNPGGGIARTGGYICGRKDLVELCAYRLTSPGTGKEVGCTLGELKNMYMGLFHAPIATGEAMKTAVFASKLLEEMGYNVYPKFDAPRTDIIQAIQLGNAQKLIAFCQGIQSGSPVDAFVRPEPWDMPGYESEVIMAAGVFNMGASIELSADAPLREPFAVWMQGGLNYYSGKIGVLMAAQAIQNLD